MLAAEVSKSLNKNYQNFALWIHVPIIEHHKKHAGGKSKKKQHF